jgi:hypothetical protein
VPDVADVVNELVEDVGDAEAVGRADALAEEAEPASAADVAAELGCGLAVEVRAAADVAIEAALGAALEAALGLALEEGVGVTVGVGVGVAVAVTAGTSPAAVTLSLLFCASRPISDRVAARAAIAMTAATTQRALLPLPFAFSFSPPSGVAGPSGFDTVTPHGNTQTEQNSTLAVRW